MVELSVGIVGSNGWYQNGYSWLLGCGAVRREKGVQCLGRSRDLLTVSHVPYLRDAPQFTARSGRLKKDWISLFFIFRLVIARISAISASVMLRFPTGYTTNTFCTSSPKWLITFTQTRPALRFGKGREMVEFISSHAVSSISLSARVSAPHRGQPRTK